MRLTNTVVAVVSFLTKEDNFFFFELKKMLLKFASCVPLISFAYVLLRYDASMLFGLSINVAAPGSSKK